MAWFKIVWVKMGSSCMLLGIYCVNFLFPEPGRTQNLWILNTNNLGWKRQLICTYTCSIRVLYDGKSRNPWVGWSQTKTWPVGWFVLQIRSIILSSHTQKKCHTSWIKEELLNSHAKMQWTGVAHCSHAVLAHGFIFDLKKMTACFNASSAKTVAAFSPAKNSGFKPMRITLLKRASGAPRNIMLHNLSTPRSRRNIHLCATKSKYLCNSLLVTVFLWQILPMRLSFPM